VSVLVDVSPYGSPEWLEGRRRGLGASEVPVLTGDDRWRGEWELAAMKRGEGPPTEETWPMRMGHLMEPVGLDWYESAMQRPVVRGETWSDPRWPHVFATLDARWERVGVEVKWTNAWETPPRHVLVQAYTQMGAADLTSVDIVRVSSREAPSVVATLERDEDIVVGIMDLAEAWWQRYIVEDAPLPVDASRAASRALDRIQGPPDMVASDEQAALAAQLRAVRRQLEEAEATERLIVNMIKDSMAGAYALAGPGFRVAWRPTKGRTTVDWKLVALDYRRLLSRFDANDADLDVIESLHTTVSEGARPFRVSYEEESQP
jgi:predicted phage-related endonuclease